MLEHGCQGNSRVLSGVEPKVEKLQCRNFAYVLQEKQRRLRSPSLRAAQFDSQMTVKPLNVGEYMVTCKDNGRADLEECERNGAVGRESLRPVSR